jgi:hypothetical protein
MAGVSQPQRTTHSDDQVDRAPQQLSENAFQILFERSPERFSWLTVTLS